MSSPINFEKKFTIAENYRKIREFRLKSQEEVVKELKLYLPGNDSIKQNVSTWETLKGNPGNKFLDPLSKILDVPMDTFYQEGLTKEYLEKNFLDRNNTQGHKPGDNKEKSPKDRAEAYQDILENYTDYVLIPRFLLESHRLTSLEQIQRDKELIEKLIEKNEKLLDRVYELKSKLPASEKTEQGPSIPNTI